MRSSVTSQCRGVKRDLGSLRDLGKSRQSRSQCFRSRYVWAGSGAFVAGGTATVSASSSVSAVRGGPVPGHGGRLGRGRLGDARLEPGIQVGAFAVDPRAGTDGSASR
jgi:hypothetical protein